MVFLGGMRMESDPAEGAQTPSFFSIAQRCLLVLFNWTRWFDVKVAEYLQRRLKADTHSSYLSLFSVMA